MLIGEVFCYFAGWLSVGAAVSVEVTSGPGATEGVAGFCSSDISFIPFVFRL
jgi:hypothetical protein